MSTTIYIVIGSTGEYSDASEWTVAAYTKEEDAKTHVIKATEYAKAWEAIESTVRERLDYDWEKIVAAKKAANPADPEFKCDYTGTSYTYQAVQLHESFTTPEPIQ